MTHGGLTSRVRAPFRVALIIVTGASLLQLLVGALGPLDGDESLYWEWARHLAWGYFDHPPGIALLIRMGVELFGVNPFGVRCVAVLANFGGALMALVLARRLGSERAALRAAVIISCIPLLTNWLMFATPDTALFLTSMGVLLLVDNALGEPGGSRRALKWWLAAGFVLGLAALAKELAILIPLGIGIACLTHPGLRRRLLEPGPYLACVVAAIVAMPVFVWNRDHDWVLLRFALQRGLGAEGGRAFGRELDFVGGQLAVVSPLLFGVLGAAVYRALRGQHDRRRHLFAVMSVVTFGWFAVAALRHAVEPNWVLMAYPPAAILLAAESPGRAASRWFVASVALGGAFVLVIYLHTAVRILPTAPADDPIRRGHGWQEVAERVDATRDQFGVRASWLAGNRFQDASQLAFHLRGHPFVFSLNLESRPNQYDFWPGFAQRAKAGDGLILLLDDSTESGVARSLAPFFSRSSEGERVAPGGAERTLTPKRIWIFEGWRGGWPPRR